MLSNPKIRHTIDQSTKTDQVTKMREMEERYETLKVTFEEQGKSDVFTLTLTFANLCINLWLIYRLMCWCIQYHTSNIKWPCWTCSYRTGSSGGSCKYWLNSVSGCHLVQYRRKFLMESRHYLNPWNQVNSVYSNAWKNVYIQRTDGVLHYWCNGGNSAIAAELILVDVQCAAMGIESTVKELEQF